MPLAVQNGPSRLTQGPEGSWPLRFDRLVQPVLDRQCTSCHNPDSGNAGAARFDLTAKNAYDNLMAFADRDLEKLAFEKDRSEVGHGPARDSKLLALLWEDPTHKEIVLGQDSLERLATWMDTYAQRQGHFSPEQESQLISFKERYLHLLEY